MESLREIEQSVLPLKKDRKDLVKTLNNGIAQIRTTYEYTALDSCCSCSLKDLSKVITVSQATVGLVRGACRVG